MTAPYDHQALWAKAKVFLNRAMDTAPSRSFDEQALWASAALELLGKAALARVSPLLIAEPTEDGVNVLIATGLIEGTAKFTSVRAATVFKRCARAFRPFDAGTAQKIADSRNEYLHGSGVGFAVLTLELWWPSFWAQAAILVTAQDREIEDLVGLDRVSTVDAYLEQNSKNVEECTGALINRAKQRLNQYRAGTLPAKVQQEWEAFELSAMLRYRAPATCPACGSAGRVEAEDADDYEVEYEYDEDGGPASMWATATVTPDYFSCSTCRLVLDRYELVHQAGLAEPFTAIDDDPPQEPEYGND